METSESDYSEATSLLAYTADATAPLSHHVNHDGKDLTGEEEWVPRVRRGALCTRWFGLALTLIGLVLLIGPALAFYIATSVPCMPPFSNILSH